jgi:hypothetical protein
MGFETNYFKDFLALKVSKEDHICKTVNSFVMKKPYGMYVTVHLSPAFGTDIIYYFKCKLFPTSLCGTTHFFKRPI